MSTLAPVAAWVSLGGAAWFVLSVMLLHLLKPELDPSWRMVSEYAMGRHGYVMVLAFFAWALSMVAAAAATMSDARTLGGWLGALILATNATGAIIAGIFITDPITVPLHRATRRSRLHAVGAMMVIPLFPVGATLVAVTLASQPLWHPARNALLWMTALTWGGLVAFMGSGVAFSKGGAFGPTVYIGWPNRFMCASYAAWLMVVAWGVLRAHG